MIPDPPASPPLQLTLPPVVHPDSHEELRLQPRLVSAGHQAVVASRQTHNLSHLTVFRMSVESL